MAETDGILELEKSLWQWARVDAVISATQFQANRLQGYGEGYFYNWACYVLRDIRSTPTVPVAPQGEQQTITAFTKLGGIVTHPAFTAPMVAGDEILMLHPNISTLPLAWVTAILAAVGPAGFNQGLCYYGVVTDVPGANQFTIATMAGLGANKFAIVGGLSYYAFVFRDAAGGVAPQGESQEITNYATNTGNFTANAFTIDVDIGDEILIIHPFLARIMNLAGLPPAVGVTTENWNAGEEDIVLLGTDNVSNKLHSLVLDISALVGSITIRLYMEVVGGEIRVYQQAFTVAADGPGLWIVNGTVGIHEVLRVTAQSDNLADDAQPIGYDYMLEAM